MIFLKPLKIRKITGDKNDGIKKAALLTAFPDSYLL